MENDYFDAELVSRKIAASSHRDVVGGEWDKIGKLQFDFMVARGLRPQHLLLDVGCGALRGGVWFVPYLDVGHYFGLDVNRQLLDCGRAELALVGAGDRLPDRNLSCSEDFDFGSFGRKFDFAIAQSLFTHLGLNRIRRCLEQIADVLTEDGVFYATFFERPEKAAARDACIQPPCNFATYDVRDPYHYSVGDFRHLCRNLPLDVEYVGDWVHPRGQMMLAFRKRNRPAT